MANDFSIDVADWPMVLLELDTLRADIARLQRENTSLKLRVSLVEDRCFGMRVPGAAGNIG